MTKTVTFEMPEELYEEMDSSIARLDEHENQSQFLRYAVRRLLNEGRLELPQEMLDDIDTIVEESMVYENRSHYLRVAHRSLQNDEGEFTEAR